MGIMDIRSKELSVINDPFSSDCLEEVWMMATKSLFSKQWEYDATVKFKKGGTTGEQAFSADSMAALAKKVDAFITALEKEA